MVFENKYKAAAVLALADRKTAKEILKELSPEEVALLGQASLELEGLGLGEEILEELLKQTKKVSAGVILCKCSECHTSL